MLSEEDKTYLILVLPPSATKYNLDKLSAWEWIDIAILCPQAISVCEWEKFADVDLGWMFNDSPEAHAYIPWTKIPENVWKYLLTYHPECHEYFEEEKFPRLNKLFKRAKRKSMENKNEGR